MSLPPTAKNADSQEPRAESREPRNGTDPGSFLLQFTDQEQKLVASYNRIRFDILCGQYPIAHMTPEEMAGNLILTRGNAKQALGYLDGWERDSRSALMQSRDFSRMKVLLEACLPGLEN